MRYVAAYLLAVLGGNKTPGKKDVVSILESIGLDIDHDKLDKVLHELDGKDINEVIAKGSAKLASMPSGGGAVAATGSGGAAATTEAAKEEKKKEEEPEEEEESDEDMGFGLFD